MSKNETFDKKVEAHIAKIDEHQRKIQSAKASATKDKSTRTKKANQYVDNEKFLQDIKDYQKLVRTAEKDGTNKKPRIPDSIGKNFMLIAENMSRKYYFIKYSFRDEMIADAIESCVKANNFDTTKFSNPFSYYSQVFYYAFIKRIEQEKEELYLKYKSSELCGVLDQYDQMAESSSGESRQYDQYDNISEFIEKYEISRAAKRSKTKDRAILTSTNK